MCSRALPPENGVLANRGGVHIRSFTVFVDQGNERAVLRKVRSFERDFRISLLRLRRHTMGAGGGVVPAQCMVPNNIACSYASDLDFFMSSKPFYSTSCGIDLPMLEEWHPTEEMRKLRTEEPHAERKKTFG